MFFLPMLSFSVKIVKKVYSEVLVFLLFLFITSSILWSAHMREVPSSKLTISVFFVSLWRPWFGFYIVTKRYFRSGVLGGLFRSWILRLQQSLSVGHWVNHCSGWQETYFGFIGWTKTGFIKNKNNSTF